MNKENITSAEIEEPTVRITRARAKAATKSGGLLPPKPPIKLDEMQVVRTNSKRPASNENKPSATANAGLQHKRRATLKDVTNVVSENSYMNCISTTKVEISKRAKRGPSNKSSKVALTVLVETPQVQEDAKTKVTGETSNIRTVETQDSTLLVNLEEDEFIQHTFSSLRTSDVADPTQLEETSIKPAQHQILSEEEEDNLFKAQGSPNGPCIADIDSDHKDPQMCSLYASDIYDNFLCRELDRRPSANFMDSVQRDITPNMRGILVDWLVEVSEEYKLVPDTLYLTVNLIDRFLSKNYIEKQRLQLLGVTCMLIASKYEEICAPHVEEFCFITDNTYTREEVLKMESQVLNFLGFQLSVPTTKKFLRRFIQAAQTSYKVPCVELEFLANYIAELTLVDYSFLKYLHSLIAASAVFLARWTLNQSDHPWNATLEHYTTYKASDLKNVVLAMQDLQLNTNGSSLNAIRDKYKLKKFKSVATLSSEKAVQELFQD